MKRVMIDIQPTHTDITRTSYSMYSMVIVKDLASIHQLLIITTLANCPLQVLIWSFTFLPPSFATSLFC